MVLQTPNIKLISVIVLLGLTLAPLADPQGVNLAAASGGSGQPPLANVANVAAAAAHAVANDAAKAPGPCGTGMLLVEGDYCPEVEHTCLKYLDPPPYETLRCGEYQKPAKCKVPRKTKRFCVDREEYHEVVAGDDPANALPVVKKNWHEAKALCAARGARLCKETEWEFACEGTEMSPYPYGWKRDSSACNMDRTDLGGAEEKLIDHRAPLSAFPQCTSPFGVHDMVGNVDEWVEREASTAPYRSALRGGWWLPARNRCRAATLSHDESYSAKQVGFRCCKDIP